MSQRLAAYALAVLWAGVIVLGLGIILVFGGGRGPVPTEYMLIGGVVLIVLSALMRPESLRRAFGIRSVRYGSNALVLTLAFIAILGLINFVGTRRTWREDFTANKQFSLSPQTIQILENLKQPVKAYAFFGPDSNPQEARDRLKEYKLHSPNFDYEIVDPLQRPDLVQQLEVTFNGAVVFQLGTKKQETLSTGESDFTSAIIKVTSDKPRVVLFLSGHRERDPNQFGDDGYSNVRQALEKDNYSVASQSLQITSTIPASTTVVVLAGPRSALTDDELKALDAYLNQGGRLLLMSDPRQPDPAPSLLSKWGIKLDEDQVVDPAVFLQGTSPLFPAVVQYTSSPITQKMTGLLTVFPIVRSVRRMEPAPANLSPQTLAQSSAQSWGETNFDPNVPARYDEGKDLKGPLDLAVSVEGTAPISPTTPATTTESTRKTRIVVIGTSELVSNRIVQSLRGAGNVDLFLNAINWLAEEEALISIRPTPPDQRFVTMTGNQLQLVFVLAVLMLPGLVLVAGLSVWWRRR